MFKKYDEEIKKIILNKSANTNWKKVLEHYRTMISHIQKLDNREKYMDIVPNYE
jgi:hypothetical protein